MKIAIVIGHNERSKGKYSEYLEKYEWDFYKEKSCELGQIGEVFYHDSTISGYTSRCKDIGKRIEEKGQFDLVISLHFNSSSTMAEGAEVWHIATNNITKDLAEKLSKEISDTFGNRNRGAKGSTPGKRGYGILRYVRPNAILIEPFFGNNPEDAAKFDWDEFLNILRGI